MKRTGKILLLGLLGVMALWGCEKEDQEGDLKEIEELIGKCVDSEAGETAGKQIRRHMALVKKLLNEKQCTAQELKGYFKVLSLQSGSPQIKS